MTIGYELTWYPYVLNSGGPAEVFFGNKCHSTVHCTMVRSNSVLLRKLICNENVMLLFIGAKMGYRGG